MSAIHIERDHTLGKEGARQAVEDVASQMKRQLDVSYNWNGDTLQFQRSGANGTIDVRDSSVTVDVELGMMFKPFKGAIEQQIKSFLDQKLR